MAERELVNLTRDVDAIQIPDGTLLTLREGSPVWIHQALGGTYTVATRWDFMVRISGRDADALGLETEGVEVESAATDRESVEKAAWQVMRTCYDPEIPVNIVDLGLVYRCEVTALGEGRNRVDIKMTLTAPGCGMGPVMQADVEHRIQHLRGVDEVDVEVVFEPPWDLSMMSEAARLELGM
jgi:probable FeS assembly SUF system protein SufT